MHLHCSESSSSSSDEGGKRCRRDFFRGVADGEVSLAIKALRFKEVLPVADDVD